MKIFYFLTLIILGTNGFSQDTLTIGEIFDFNVGDEFHYNGILIPENDYPFPDFEKVIVLGKELFEHEDSLVIIKEITKYKFSYDTEPHEYFISNIDTHKVIFQDIDSSIRYYDYLYQNDTTKNEGTWEIYLKDTIFQSSEYLCNTSVNGVEFYQSWGEYDHYINYYGKGLGLVFSSSHGSSDGPYIYNKKMIYYKKGQQTCGEINLPSAIEVIKIDNYKIFPIPFNNELTIKSKNKFDMMDISIFDINGTLVYSKSLDAFESKIDVSNLSTGLYLLELNYKDNRMVKRIIKQ